MAQISSLPAIKVSHYKKNYRHRVGIRNACAFLTVNRIYAPSVAQFLLKKDLFLNKKKLAVTYFPAKSSIIGVRELDFRVRNGNGYCLSTKTTSIFILDYF